ncbi:CBS domain-containing protein CBSCBSPB3, partial [Dichanthelium oligosanthes]
LSSSLAFDSISNPPPPPSPSPLLLLPPPASPPDPPPPPPSAKMATRSASRPRRLPRRAPSPPPPAAANGKAAAASKPTSPVHPSLERTVKKLRLTRALTLTEDTVVSEACRRMAAKRVDAALLTDANGMLSGILTAEDIAGRVIAEGLNPEETSVVKGMTRNPVFVMSNSLAIDALQKMVQGKFKHLPVVECGQVIAMLDITKFLYDAISRMEMAAEQGSAIAAAMEGVERQWGNDFPGPNAFVESLREQMFKPSLSTIVTENSSVPVVSPSDPVILAAKKMREHRVNSVVVMTGDMLLGIFTSKDLVLRVVAQNLPPETTLVEKAMTANPECATLDTSILDALHSMQDGKFLHIPVVDKSKYCIVTANSFCFKIEDKKGRMHRFSCVSESLGELVSAVAYRLGIDSEKSSINLLSEARTESTLSIVDSSTAQGCRPPLRFGMVAVAVAIAGVTVIVYLKRSQL